MTNPIGLTRDEEAMEQQQPEVRIVVKAQPGAAVCRVGKAVTGIDCEAAATCQIVWQDGDRTPACADCAGRAELQAENLHTSVRIEPLR